MKKEIHPDNYRPVIFVDDTSGEKFLIKSTVNSKETGEWTDKKEYPVVHIEISSASHPFYTGKETVVDTAGRGTLQGPEWQRKELTSFEKAL